MALPNKQEDWQSSFDSVQESNLYLLSTGKLSDVTFVIGPEKKKINAHKLILMSRSPVFETMFERWNPENSTVAVADASFQAFEYFLTFLYTNEFQFEVEDAGAVLYLAHKYNVAALATRCSNLMKTGINVQSVIGIYQVAKLLEQDELKKKAFEFMLKNAKMLLERDVSASMELDTFVMLLSSSELDVDEILIFKAVIRWAERQCSKRNLKPTATNKRSVAERLVPLIRFPIMDVESFTDEVVTKNKGFLLEREILQLLVYLTAGKTTKASLQPMLFNTERREMLSLTYSVVPAINDYPRATGNRRHTNSNFINLHSILRDGPNYTQTVLGDPSSVFGILTFSVSTDVHVISFELDLSNNPYIKQIMLRNTIPMHRYNQHQYYSGVGTLESADVTNLKFEAFLIPAPAASQLVPAHMDSKDACYFTISSDSMSSINVACTPPIKITGGRNYQFLIKDITPTHRTRVIHRGSSEVTIPGNENIQFKFYWGDNPANSGNGKVSKINFSLNAF